MMDLLQRFEQGDAVGTDDTGLLHESDEAEEEESSDLAARLGDLDLGACIPVLR
jgi:hypothetical protein